MADLKTRPQAGDPKAFLAAVPDPERRADALAMLELMAAITGQEPQLWGPSIVGFGTYRYHYESGREGDWFPVGFSPRKRDLTLYLLQGFPERAELLERLGPHREGKSCVYIRRLADVDPAVLRALIAGAYNAAGSSTRQC
jgi:hypothetical protein